MNRAPGASNGPPLRLFPSCGERTRAVELPATQAQRAACGPANQMQAEIRGKSFVDST
jgi:hypothetical protein